MGRSQTSDSEDLLNNYVPNHLYKSDFGDGTGSYFTIVAHEDGSTDIPVSKKISLRISHIKDNDEVKSVKFSKLKEGVVVETFSLTTSGINQLCAMVKVLEKLNFSEITERKTTLISSNQQDINLQLLKKFLSEVDADETITQLMSDGTISSHDIVNTGYRRQQLEVYRRFLNEAGFLHQYADENFISKAKDEKIWQHFFEKNEWIFGYGLDYRFQSILQRESHISSTDLDGSNSVITDYLMGDKLFTTFVEIKKPDTKLFGNSKNRSNSWCLSHDFIDAVSQILEQKASGQIELAKETKYNSKEEPITQKAYDSKVILLIGQWSELSSSKTIREQDIKKKTFELYRRDSRNIEILTYDELYDRARFIVEGQLQIVKPPLIEDDGLPF